MAVAETTCTADPTRVQMRRWSKHQWTCASCAAVIRWYAGLGWHHYIQRRMSGVVFTDAVEVQSAVVTAGPARPHLYLVPSLVEPAPSCTNSQCPCSITAAPASPPVSEQPSTLLAA